MTRLIPLIAALLLVAGLFASPASAAPRNTDWAKWYTVQVKTGYASIPDISGKTYTAWGVYPGQLGGIPQGTMVAPNVTYSSFFLVTMTGVSFVSDLHTTDGSWFVSWPSILHRVIRSDGKIICEYYDPQSPLSTSHVERTCVDYG